MSEFRVTIHRYGGRGHSSAHPGKSETGFPNGILMRVHCPEFKETDDARSRFVDKLLVKYGLKQEDESQEIRRAA
jgi:hypothetical protein